MYLFEEKGKKINLYGLQERESISNFKKEEMTKIPIDEQVYYAYTNGYKALEEKCDEFTIGDLRYYGGRLSGFNREVHKFQEDIGKGQAGDVVGSYIDGDYTSGKPIVVSFDGVNKYFILTERKYRHFLGYADKPSCDSHLDDIICIPYSLYVLQTLERGDFCRLFDASCANGEFATRLVSEPERKMIDDLEAMDLYRFFELSREPVKTFDRSLLYDILSVGLVLPQKDDALKQMRASNEVLKRMRKKK